MPASKSSLSDSRFSARFLLRHEVQDTVLPWTRGAIFPRDPLGPIRKILPCVTHSHSSENEMPAQTRVGKIIGPYKKRKLDRKPISPYTRGPNSAQIIKSMVGVENKYFDVEVATNFVASVNYGLLTTTTGNPQILLGDEVYQRNGRQILLKKVIFRGNVFTTPITAQTAAAPCTSGRLS